MTLIPWKAGKPVVWDVTAICTTASSYIDSSTREAGAAAEIAATRKTTWYSHLSSQHTFYPIAVETLGSLNEYTRLFLAILADVYPQRQVTFAFARFLFCFREFLLLLSVSTLYCCTTVLLRMTSRNKCHSSEIFCNFLTSCGFVLVGSKK